MAAGEQQRRCTLAEFGRRFTVVLVCVCIFYALFLLENERTLNSPQPRTLSYMVRYDSVGVDSNSKSKSSQEQGLKRTSTTTSSKLTTTKPPFNYLRTRKWGKLDKEAWQLHYGDLDCHENHRKRSMIAILRMWFKLAKEFDIEYAFYFGSLLGIVRTNDVVPWDHDMDILVKYSDIPKLEKVGWPRTNSRARDGMTFINYIPNSQHNVSIDDRKRWTCDGKPTDSHVDQCAIQEPLVRIYNSAAFLDVFSYWSTKDYIEFITEGHHFKFKKTDHFPLRQCRFMGLDTWCPNNPDNLLRDYYGKHYLTPSKKCKHGQWI